MENENLEWISNALSSLGFFEEKIETISSCVVEILEGFQSRIDHEKMGDMTRYMIISIYIYICMVGVGIDSQKWKNLCLKNHTSVDIKESMRFFISVMFPHSLDISSFTKIEKLGKSNATVYLGFLNQESKLGENKHGTPKEGNDIYAVKQFKRQNNDMCHFVREIWALRVVKDHEFCVQFYGAWFDESGAYIIMKPYKMTLHKYIGNNGPLNLIESKKVMKSLFEIVFYAHSKKVVHRDIKPQNIMMDGDKLVLADWDSSFCTTFPRPSYYDEHTNPVCTLPFRPPELLSKDVAFKYDLYKIDVWSITCVFFFCLLGEYLFHGEDEREVLSNILAMRSEKMKNKHKWNDLIKTYLHLEECEFLENTLHINPTKRISVEIAKKNEFLKS